MNYIGIDPGANGSATSISDNGDIDICEFKKNTPHDIASWFYLHGEKHAGHRATFAYLENVHSMPRQGVSSTFKFGKALGFVEGLLIAYNIPYELVTPAKWQGAMKCRTKGDKNVTKAAAQRLFADSGIKITHAKADSMLIAEHCKRKRLEEK